MNERRIKSIEARAGIPVFKTMTEYGRPGWGITVVVTLMDDSTQVVNLTAMKRKDLFPLLRRYDEGAKAARVLATFDDANKFHGFITR